MQNPKCNSCGLEASKQSNCFSKKPKPTLKKDFVFYKPPDFSLGKILTRFQNYWIGCLSFSQTNRVFTSLRKAVGFEHLHTHMPRSLQPQSLRLLITSLMCLVLLSRHYIQFHIAYEVHLLLLPPISAPTHPSSMAGFPPCLARDPSSLLLGQINRLKIKGRQ